MQVHIQKTYCLDVFSIEEFFQILFQHDQISLHIDQLTNQLINKCYHKQVQYTLGSL